MSDLECPYCKEDQDVCHDDGQGWDEDKPNEMTCCHCKKQFVFYTSVSYDYEPHKADCLNGHPHNFAKWRHLWDSKGKRVEYRKCRDCEHEDRRKLDLPHTTNN